MNATARSSTGTDGGALSAEKLAAYLGAAGVSATVPDSVQPGHQWLVGATFMCIRQPGGQWQWTVVATSETRELSGVIERIEDVRALVAAIGKDAGR